GRKRRQSSALLKHEKSNDIALNCATTKRNTVVCSLYMERAIAYLRVSTQRQQRSALASKPNAPQSNGLLMRSPWPSLRNSSSSTPAKGRTHLRDGLSSPSLYLPRKVRSAA